MLLDHLDDVLSRRKSGQTLREIAEAYGVSRQRIQQVCSCHGVVLDRPKSKNSPKPRRKQTQEEKERKCYEKWGVSCAEWAAFRAMAKNYRDTPLYAYGQCRAQAKIRNVNWELSLSEWWRIWRESGKYDERGSGGNQYCMTRCRDDGPYAWWNVRIRTMRENLREYRDVTEQESARKHLGRLGKRTRSFIDEDSILP